MTQAQRDYLDRYKRYQKHLKKNVRKIPETDKTIYAKYLGHSAEQVSSATLPVKMKDSFTQFTPKRVQTMDEGKMRLPTLNLEVE